MRSTIIGCLSVGLVLASCAASYDAQDDWDSLTEAEQADFCFAHNNLSQGEFREVLVDSVNDPNFEGEKPTGDQIDQIMGVIADEC